MLIALCEHEIKVPVALLLGRNRLSKSASKDDIDSANEQTQLVPVVDRWLIWKRRSKVVQGWGFGWMSQMITAWFEPPESGGHAGSCIEDSAFFEHLLLGAIGTATNVRLLATELGELFRDAAH